MNAHDLLDLIGDAKGTYLWEAQQHRESDPQTKRLSFRKAWLIAAIIALMLLLVGCTVTIIMNLSSLSLVENSHTDQRTGETQTWNILSLQGFVGSGNYQATKEWYEFLQTDTAPYNGENFDRPAAYDAYECWSQSRKDKIDEICEKYGLELLGESHHANIVKPMLQALEVYPITNEAVEMDFSMTAGEYYNGGSFFFYGEITLTGENTPWPHTAEYSFSCIMKNVFDDTYLNIGDIKDYTQWTYTTKNEIELLLAVSENKALILVDREDFFVTVDIANPKLSTVVTEEEFLMDKAALEAIAEAFDFSFRAQPVTAEDVEAVNNYYDWEEMQKEHAEDLGKESYAARVKYHLEESSDPERLGFAFLDIDGNGVNELLIGKDGYCIAVYTEVDGMTEQYSNACNYFYPCEGGILVCAMEVEDCHYYINRVNGSSMELIAHVQYCPAYFDIPEEWRYYTDWNKYDIISKDAFNEIVNSYSRIPVEMLPLTEYPLYEEVNRNISDSLYSSDTDYSDKVRMRLTTSSEQWYRWQYCLLDLDGNGQEELIWREDSRETVYTMSQGRIKSLAYGKDLAVCEDGMIEIITSYGPKNKTYCYYRLDGDHTVLIDYLRYDADVDPDNPWFRSSDASGQDVSMVPISMDEFDSILSRYPPLDLDMKPIAEYPLD